MNILHYLINTLVYAAWHPVWTPYYCFRRLLFTFTRRFVGPSFHSPEGVMIFNVQTLVSYGCIFILREQRGRWENEIRDHSAPVIFDIGSNYGLFGAYARSINPGAVIISAEPQSGMPHPLSALHFAGALGFGPEKQLRPHTSLGGQTASTAGLYDSDPVTVPCITLDELWQRAGRPEIDVLKIDVDGGEREIIESGRECLGHVRHLIVEISDAREANQICHWFGKPSYHRLMDYTFELKTTAVN